MVYPRIVSTDDVGRVETLVGLFKKNLHYHQTDRYINFSFMQQGVAASLEKMRIFTYSTAPNVLDMGRWQIP
jgi:hypothetical protein